MAGGLNEDIHAQKLNDEKLDTVFGGYKANSFEVYYSGRKKCYYTTHWDEDRQANVFVKIPVELVRKLISVTKKMVKIVGDPYCSECVNWDLAGKYEEATGKDITNTIENFS